MREAFRQIPIPLQKQILYRLGSGIVTLLISIAVLFSSMELFSILSCAAITAACAVSSFLLFRRVVIGDYVIVSGECLGVTLTAVRRRTKMIMLRTTDGQKLQIVIRQRLKKISASSRVTLYVAANMPVYDRGDA